MSTYHTERNKKTLALLESAKAKLPAFCSRFFLGVAQTTAPLTRLGYSYDLKVFFTFLTTEAAEFIGKKPRELTLSDLRAIAAFHIELFIDWLGYHTKGERSYTNNERSVERKLCTLRTFFAYFFKIGELEANIMPIVSLPKIHQKNIVRLDDDETERILLAVADKDAKTKGQQRFHEATSLRDQTILVFFLSTGIRISELVGLNCGDIDLKNASFVVTRKGGSQTILYMSDELVAQLELYLNGAPEWDEVFDERTKNSPLFTSIQGTRLGVRAVQNLVKKYAATAAPLKKISPHKLRSTFGTNLYRETKDIYVVADLLGHTDVNTTKKHYAAQSDDIRRAAAKRISLKTKDE